MKHTIFTSSKEIEKLNFTPTLMIAFYKSGHENYFTEEISKITTYFPKLDIIGSSSESNIHPELPHIDIQDQYPFVFLFLDIEKEAYILESYAKNALPCSSFFQEKDYTTLIFHVLPKNIENESNLEKVISLFQKDLNHTSLVGGIAGHSLLDEAGSIYYNGKFFSDNHILLCHIDQSQYQVSAISFHAYKPIGGVMEVTKSHDYTLVEINNKPALKVMEAICGTISPELITSYEFPLFITPKNGNNSYKKPLTAIHSVDRQNHTITLHKVVHRGDNVQLAMPVNRQEQEIQLEMFSKYHKKNAVALLFVCISYKGQWEDMEAIYLMHLSKSLDVPFMGLHTLGEVGPLNVVEPSQYQNQTITLCVISKKEK